jgi:hypothetical protein
MASLTESSVSGMLTTNGVHYPAGESMTEWYNIYHCTNDTLDSAQWVHVRTPVPADILGGVTYMPWLLEVKGYHTYGGESYHDWACVINVDAGDGFTANIRRDSGYTSSPYVYRSTSLYGGTKRVCFSMRKQGCCCNGWFWVRWNINNGFRTNYAWGKIGTTSQTTAAF